MLSILIFFPIAIALLLISVPSNSRVFRAAALLTTVLQLVVSVQIGIQYGRESGAYRLVEKLNWISFAMGDWGTFSAYYWVGLDGMSLPLVLLAVVVFIIAALSSWNIGHHTKGYFILFLILDGAVMGTFAAMDTLLFFVFFEFMLIPMYFLIGIWGAERREYASIKFFLYTLLGSIFILIVIIGIYSSAKNPNTLGGTLQHSFGMPHLSDPDNFIVGSLLDPASTETVLGFTWRQWAFLMLFLGFAIKLPVVPFHTWLPAAHVEAPTPISILLAALLLKVGGYGLIRLAYTIFPTEAASFSVMTGMMALLSIIYGALNAMASKDLKRMIAYSSISHMGFVLLGAASGTTEGIAGAVYQMVSHGLISAMLFAIAGVLSDRTHNRTIDNYSGLFVVAPKYTAFVLLAFFAAMGMPGFSAFIGEIMILFGAFASHTQNGLLPAWIPVAATLGIILSASYYVWTIQRMFFGKLLVHENKTFDDLSQREWVMLLPLAILILLLGVWPQPLLDLINAFAVGMGGLF
jgi:NADH-quinone oxidoreductase subunit M